MPNFQSYEKDKTSYCQLLHHKASCRSRMYTINYVSGPDHIQSILPTADRIVSLQRHITTLSSLVNTMSYKSLVRPQIEYCRTIWESHKCCTNQLEHIQNWAVRFIPHGYRQFRNVTAMKSMIGLWKSVESHPMRYCSTKFRTIYWAKI